MKLARYRLRLRNIRAGWRDTILLVREFRWPLILFALLLIIGGSLYRSLSLNTDTPINNWVESVFLMLSLTFLQAFGEFPHVWYLQIFFFIMPVIGVAILARGLTEFGILLFNRRARNKEWEVAVASTFENHIILVGLGHLGYRVLLKLNELEQDVVVIERNMKAEKIEAVKRLGIPIIEDDGVREEALNSAGIRKANRIILCTQNDSVNLQMALKARSLNPKIDVIIRIFEDDFAEALHKQFGFKALSATGMAAPIFAALAANIDVTPPLTINGEPNSLAKVVISKSSQLVGLTVGEIEDRFNISVVMLLGDGSVDLHPSAVLAVHSSDTIAVFGDPNPINQVIHASLH